MKRQRRDKSRMFATMMAMTILAATAMPVGSPAQGNAVREHKATLHH
jgi:hypothetical protein